MKKKKKLYPKKFKDHVRRVCVALKTISFTGEYMMNLCWHDTPDEKDREDGEKGEVVASITPDFRYLEFTIHIQPQLLEYWKDLQSGDEKIGRALLHEFCHMLIDPVWHFGSRGMSKERWDQYTDIRERQTQRVAYALFDHLPKKLWKRKIKKDESHKPKRR